jgi:hypothetical protein
MLPLYRNFWSTETCRSCYVFLEELAKPQSACRRKVEEGRRRGGYIPVVHSSIAGLGRGMDIDFVGDGDNDDVDLLYLITTQQHVSIKRQFRPSGRSSMYCCISHF